MLAVAFVLAGPLVITATLLQSRRSRRRQHHEQQVAAESTRQTLAYTQIAAHCPSLQDCARLSAVCKAARRLETALDAVSGGTVVRCVGSRLCAGGVAFVLRALSRPANADVEELELHSCRLGLEGSLVLAAGLEAHPWLLRGLSLREDDLGEEGAEALVQRYALRILASAPPPPSLDARRAVQRGAELGGDSRARRGGVRRRRGTQRGGAGARCRVQARSAEPLQQ